LHLFVKTGQKVQSGTVRDIKIWPILSPNSTSHNTHYAKSSPDLNLTADHRVPIQ